MSVNNGSLLLVTVTTPPLWVGVRGAIRDCVDTRVMSEFCDMVLLRMERERLKMYEVLDKRNIIMGMRQ